MKTITVTPEPFQRFRIELEDRLVEITLSYGSLRDRWSFDLAEAGVPLITGQRLVSGTDLLRAFGLKLGGLLAVERARAGLDQLDPNGDNFPDNFELVHLTQVEVDSLVAAI